MADIQIGKNKYKLTFTLIAGAFTILVSSIGWVLSLQMTVGQVEQQVEELKQQMSVMKEMEDEIDEVVKRNAVIQNDMRSIMSEHNSFNEILREMGKVGYGDKREYGNYD